MTMLGLSILSALLLLAGCTTDVDRGQTSLGQRDYNTAIEFFEKVQESDPEYAAARAGLDEAYFQLGMLAFGQSQWEAATEHLAKVDTSHPRYAESRNSLGEAHFQLGMLAFGQSQWEATIEHLAKVDTNHPRYTESQKSLGEACYRAGVRSMDAEIWPTAVDWLSKIPAEHPRYRLAQSLLQKARREQNTITVRYEVPTYLLNTPGSGGQTSDSPGRAVRGCLEQVWQTVRAHPAAEKVRLVISVEGTDQYGNQKAVPVGTVEFVKEELVEIGKYVDAQTFMYSQPEPDGLPVGFAKVRATWRKGPYSGWE